MAQWEKRLWAGKKSGPNPTDRAKSGVKRSVLTEGHGVPIGLAIAGANRHDMKLVRATLESIVVERPQPTEKAPQGMCLDKGYDNPTGKAAIEKHHYAGHVRRIGEEKMSKARCYFFERSIISVVLNPLR